MKTHTKYALILLATLSVSGCFSEDAKSYVESSKVSENVVQEELEDEVKYGIECWMGDSIEPTHYFKVTKFARLPHSSTSMRLPDGSILPVSNCLVLKL